MKNAIQVVVIDATNQSIYDHLMQSYEGEFSAITRKMPGVDGKFPLDTILGADVTGYLLLVNDRSAGIAAIKRAASDSFEVCEFYVVPACRRLAIGTQFAHTLWAQNPGDWTIKQIAGAESASQFWRAAIHHFAGLSFSEDRYIDPYWGEVTRQRFRVEPGREPIIS